MKKCPSKECPYFEMYGECSSSCRKNGYTKILTNFDRIKNMSVEELADFICDIYASNEHIEIRVDGKWMFPEDVEEWLEREVDVCSP